jgi:hypothetical protein
MYVRALGARACDFGGRGDGGHDDVRGDGEGAGGEGEGLCVVSWEGDWLVLGDMVGTD